MSIITAFNVVRNGGTGFVSFVAKERIHGDVHTTGYICGLGTMTHEEFIAYRTWAHSLKPQEYRKECVLASPKAITEASELKGRIKQAKTDVKEKAKVKRQINQKQKPKTKVPKRTVRKNYPVREMAGYKGFDKGKSHTQMMREQETERKEVRTKEQVEKERLIMSKTEIKALQTERVKQRKEYRHWDLIVSEGGLYSAQKEKAERAKAKGKIEYIDKRLKGLE